MEPLSLRSLLKGNRVFQMSKDPRTVVKNLGQVAVGRERGAGRGGVQPLLEQFRNEDERKTGPNRVDLFSQRQKVVKDYPRGTFIPSPFLKLAIEGLYRLGLKGLCGSRSGSQGPSQEMWGPW